MTNPLADMTFMPASGGAAAPEPGTLTLAGLGLAALIRRRRTH